MLTLGVVFNRYFNISDYSDEEILERYRPGEEEDLDSFEITYPPSSGNYLKATKKTVYADNMRIVSVDVSGEGEEIARSIYASIKVQERACPELIKVAFYDGSLIIVAYPYFENDKEETEKIDRAIEELGRIAILSFKRSEFVEDFEEMVCEYVEMSYHFLECLEDELDPNRPTAQRIFSIIPENFLPEDDK